MFSGVKFIYFDVGNIFMTFDRIFTQVTNDFHLDKDRLNQIYEPYDVDATLGKLTIQEIWPKLCNSLEIKNGSDYNFIRSWVSDYQSIVPMHELVPQLVNRYKIGILSNYYWDFFNECISQKFIPDLSFSPIIISAEVHCKKPEVEIYKIAENKCGFSGKEILFIDDKQENLNTAATLNWQTFLFDYKQPKLSTDHLKHLLNV